MDDNYFDDCDVDYDREVAGINYKMMHCYGTDGKVMALIEAHHQRLGNKYARAMRVKVGEFKGHWACYVSYCNKGE